MAVKISLGVAVILFQYIHLISAQGYIAAVADYTPLRNLASSPETDVLANVREYDRLTQLASNRSAQIIVFPEYGLTTFDLPENLDAISAPISVNANPCNNGVNNTKFLVDLSCAARTHRIYTVVNLLERETDTTTNTTLYYSTNVLFDRNGTIQNKYRKIHLNNEPRLTAGSEIVTFRTDFGITFGVFISLDILYVTPALDILQFANVTDVVYSHAWTSETPFLHSLSIQDGYARTNGVNFIASGYNNATAGNGGAGIFTANVAANALSISTAGGRNIVSLSAPVLTSRNPSSACQDNSPPEIEPRAIGGTLPDISTFATYTEDITLYTFVPLELNTTNIEGRVCNEGTQFCCTYSIRVAEPLTENSTVYKFGAFDGIRNLGETTIGVRTCALVACLDNVDQTCGTRSGNRTSNVNFTFINIVVSNEQDTETYYQPSTLTYQLQPIVNYTFCDLRNEANTNIAEVRLRQPHSSVFSFGVFGRVHTLDGQPPRRNGAYGAQMNFALSMVTLIATYVFVHA